MFTTDEIDGAVFSRTLCGYSPREVDEFLEHIKAQIDELSRENEKLRQTIAAAPEEKHESTFENDFDFDFDFDFKELQALMLAADEDVTSEAEGEDAAAEDDPASDDEQEDGTAVIHTVPVEHTLITAEPDDEYGEDEVPSLIAPADISTEITEDTDGIGNIDDETDDSGDSDVTNDSTTDNDITVDTDEDSEPENEEDFAAITDIAGDDITEANAEIVSEDADDELLSDDGSETDRKKHSGIGAKLLHMLGLREDHEPEEEALPTADVIPEENAENGGIFRSGSDENGGDEYNEIGNGENGDTSRAGADAIADPFEAAAFEAADPVEPAASAPVTPVHAKRSYRVKKKVKPADNGDAAKILAALKSEYEDDADLTPHEYDEYNYFFNDNGKK